MNKKIGNIVFNTWAGAFFQKGGGEVQLLKSKEALEKLGLNISMFDLWNPQDADILHQFSIELGVEHVVKKYKELGKKIALSTIMWTPPPKDNYFFDRIKYLLDTSDVLLTNSDMESSRISEYFNVDIAKFHKTRNSIGEAYLSNADKNMFLDRYNIKDDFVLSVANIDQRKNTFRLVQACKRLNIPLITVGHIKDSDYYNSFCGEYEKYLHLGPIEDEEMLKSAYSACALFALPSLCETPGIAALEAGSQGAKIVITQEGSALEYFLDYAAYVDPLNLESLIEGIRSKLSESKTSTLSKLIRENYTWDQTAKEIVEAYKRIKKV